LRSKVVQKRHHLLLVKLLDHPSLDRLEQTSNPTLTTALPRKLRAGHAPHPSDPQGFAAPKSAAFAESVAARAEAHPSGCSVAIFAR